MWRSMYAVHLRGWLQLYPPAQLRVIDPVRLFSSSAAERALSMRMLLGDGRIPLSQEVPLDDIRAVSQGSLELTGPAATHENALRYVVQRSNLPIEISQRLAIWLRPLNCELAFLLQAHMLGGDRLQDVPWLVADLCTLHDKRKCTWDCAQSKTSTTG